MRSMAAGKWQPLAQRQTTRPCEHLSLARAVTSPRPRHSETEGRTLEALIPTPFTISVTTPLSDALSTRTRVALQGIQGRRTAHCMCPRCAKLTTASDGGHLNRLGLHNVTTCAATDVRTDGGCVRRSQLARFRDHIRVTSSNRR